MNRIIKSTNYLPSDRNDNLKKYLANFDYKRLSHEEKIDLIIKYQKGDLKAFDVLVKGHMKLIIKIAKTFLINGVALEDLIQEGVLGLKFAIDHHKSNKMFSHKIASLCIYRSISYALSTLTHVVSIPPMIQEKHRKVWKHIESFEQIYEKLLSPDDVVNDVIDDIDMAYNIYQLPRDLADTTYRINDFDIFESESEEMDEFIDLKYNKDYVHYLLGQLSTREKFILINFYGLEGAEKQLALKDIGSILGISRERVRQILMRSIRILREENMHIYRKEPRIGDFILLNKTEEIGKVIDTSIIRGSKVLFLHMESGYFKKVDVYKTSFLVLPRLSSQEEIKEEIELKKYYGIKEGDQIEYKHKKAIIRKITYNGSSTKLLIMYKNESFAYVPNDMSNYKIITAAKETSITTRLRHYKR